MVQKSAWELEQQRGVKNVDTEHQLLTRLVATLRDAVETRRERAAVRELLRRLEDTAKVHFLGEELLMRLDAYEHYGAHVEEHRKLLDQLAALCERFEADPALDMADHLAWVEDWLGDHIKGMDRRFTESLNVRADDPS